MRVLRSTFDGRERTVAVAIYQALTEVANENYRNGGRGGFTATRKEIAEYAGVSTKTLDAYMPRLEATGLVEVDRTVGPNGSSNEYALVDPEGRHAASAPPTKQGAPGAEAASPPSIEEEEKSEEGQEPPLSPSDSLFALDLGAEPKVPKKITTVNRKPVTDAEYDFAVAVLAVWNVVAGQALTAGSYLTKIVARHREHPELAVADHEAIIRRNLANPWWNGDADPRVVYGSDAQFERSMLERGERTPETRGERQAEAIRKLQAFREEEAGTEGGGS